jgi:hypothetical protein
MSHYAGSMLGDNQEPGFTTPAGNQAPADLPAPLPFPGEAVLPPATALPSEAEPGWRNRGLAIWLFILFAFGVGGLLLGMEELSALIALAGLFVGSQAADADPRLKGLYYLVSWIVPAAGAAASLALAVLIGESDLPIPVRFAIGGIAMGTAGVALLTYLRPFSNGLVAALFRTVQPSHTLRLAARITILALLLSIPGWFAFRSVFTGLLSDPTPLLERVSLGGELVGYIAVALASVGFMVRRDITQTLERLALKPLTRAHVAIVALGVVGLYGLNAGADWLQRALLPELWESDHRVNQMIAEGLGVGRVLLLGLSAGFGEEITLRGALQPKLGLVVTSLLFASLHVQYSWFGIAVIFLLGLILGAIRNQTSTTAAVAVHVIYDVVAIFSV